MPVAPACTSCGTPVQPDWDWCMACGFDPGHLKPAGWVAPKVPPPARAGLNAAAPALRPPIAQPWAGAPTSPKARSTWSVGSIIGLVAFFAIAVAAVGFVGSKTLGQPAAEDPTARAAIVSLPPVTAAPTIVATEPAWVTITASDGSFTVQFPTTPQETTEKTPKGFDEVSLTATSLTNIVVVSRTPLGQAGTPALEREALSSSISAVTASGGTGAETTFRDHAAATFDMTTPAGAVIKGIAVIKNATLYSLYVSGPAALAQAQRFFDSFQFTA